VNRTEEAILKTVQDGNSKSGKIFAAAQACEESRFMGDGLFWLYLARMTQSKRPLRRASHGGFVLPSLYASLPEFNEQQIVITQAGERVLANELDWIEINGIDKWLGGVHLTTANLWRWDRKAQSLVRTKV
jgi:hypothetical protein